MQLTSYGHLYSTNQHCINCMQTIKRKWDLLVNDSFKVCDCGALRITIFQPPCYQTNTEPLLKTVSYSDPKAVSDRCSGLFRHEIIMSLFSLICVIASSLAKWPPTVCIWLVAKVAVVIHHSTFIAEIRVRNKYKNIKQESAHMPVMGREKELAGQDIKNHFNIKIMARNKISALSSKIQGCSHASPHASEMVQHAALCVVLFENWEGEKKCCDEICLCKQQGESSWEVGLLRCLRIWRWTVVKRESKPRSVWLHAQSWDSGRTWQRALQHLLHVANETEFRKQQTLPGICQLIHTHIHTLSHIHTHQGCKSQTSQQTDCDSTGKDRVTISQTL